jgi:hypothetical protein
VVDVGEEVCVSAYVPNVLANLFESAQRAGDTFQGLVKVLGKGRDVGKRLASLFAGFCLKSCHLRLSIANKVKRSPVGAVKQRKIRVSANPSAQ